MSPKRTGPDLFSLRLAVVERAWPKLPSGLGLANCRQFRGSDLRGLQSLRVLTILTYSIHLIISQELGAMAK